MEAPGRLGSLRAQFLTSTAVKDRSESQASFPRRAADGAEDRFAAWAWEHYWPAFDRRNELRPT